MKKGYPEEIERRKKGEKEGSTYMLDYLRNNKYKNQHGVKVPFFDDTGYTQFKIHLNEEKDEEKKKKL